MLSRRGLSSICFSSSLSRRTHQQSSSLPLIFCYTIPRSLTNLRYCSSAGGETKEQKPAKKVASFSQPAHPPPPSPAASSSSAAADDEHPKAAETSGEEIAAPNQEQQCESSSSTTTTDKIVDGKKVEEPLWPNCDTVEEIIEEEKYGGSGKEGEEEGAPNQVEPEHIVLALRALIYGTALAFFGVGVIALVSMKFCGFANLAEVLEWVGSKDKRQMEEMKREGVEVIEYNLDLTQPTSVPQQLSDLWTEILELSGVDKEIENAVAAAADHDDPTTAAVNEKGGPLASVNGEKPE